KVVLQLLKRDISVIVADLDINKNKDRLENDIKKIGKDKNLLRYEQLDITDIQNVEKIFQKYDLDSVINLAYGIGAICEENPLLASKINIVGTTSIFDMIVKYRIRRLVFASSETVYGANQEFFGNKAVSENDFTGIDNHFFTYGVMKLLNEFMAEKYIKKHGCSIAYTRPSVVFGYGRQNTALNWAEDFAAMPALDKTANLPFSKNNKDNWIYVDDCAEQLVRLTLKEKLNYSCFNTGSETLDGHQLEKTVKKIIPNANLIFDENIKSTPLIDDQNDERIRKEIDFNPRSFEDGVKCLVNDVRENQ
ncbi:MAG: NAD-dependent epimerase/dehydratase family protein, partial [Proteobacteria bacterium]|nr:NAD-dependent epimerase/dehydratase family protein [Pseudomonadota bacterium]